MRSDVVLRFIFGNHDCIQFQYCKHSIFAAQRTILGLALIRLLQYREGQSPCGYGNLLPNKHGKTFKYRKMILLCVGKIWVCTRCIP